MAIRLPFNVPKVVQAVIATLAAVGAFGTALLHAWAGFLTPDQSLAVSGVLTTIAAAAGFLEKAEPVIDVL